MAESCRDRLRAIEFYAGVGGFHYSLLRSGINADVIASFDLNPTANKIYSHNFPNTAHLNRNICGLSASELDCLSPDFMHMSPPCQPFTRQGLRRDNEDRRTDSFFHLVLIISEMSKPPNYILMENVQGFENSQTRTEFTQTLAKVGYTYQEFLLSPNQFGVPNSRLRYYLLAKRKPLHFALELSVQPSHDAQALLECVYTESLPSPLLPPLSNYLEQLSNEQLQSLLVPNQILSKYALALDVVRPSSTHSCCFTRGYGNYAVGTGSILQHNLTEEEMHEKFKLFQEKRKTCDDDSLVVKVLLPLSLRYFSPREVANLMCFPGNFSIPNDVTLRQCYKVLGNSLNVLVVSVLVKYLLRDQ